jgi:hypothetical protein
MVCIVDVNYELEDGGKLRGVGKGEKKREAERQAALDACVQLDEHGLFLDWIKISEKSKERVKGYLEGEESEDEYLDRTKHKAEPKKVQAESVVETLDTLKPKLEAVNQELKAFDERIAQMRASGKPYLICFNISNYLISIKRETRGRRRAG